MQNTTKKHKKQNLKKVDFTKKSGFSGSTIGGILNSKNEKAERRRHYPELLAKTYTAASKVKPEPLFSGTDFKPAFFVEYNRPEPQDLRYRCTRSYLSGSTSNNYYFKAITCGKDWCPDCGSNLSETHKRRIMPVIDRFKSLQQSGEKIGYLVVTIPKNLRDRFKSQEALTDFRNYFRRKLKRETKGIGVMRYHWAGEDGFKWHPHLNILLPMGYVSKETLEKWRNELGQWFSDYCNLPECKYWDEEKKEMVQDFPKGNFYYHYLKPEDEGSESKLFHWVKYIFRATQTVYNKETAQIIKKYRNTSIFGKKSDWPKRELTDNDLIAKALKGFEVDKETGEVEKIIWNKYWNENLQKWVIDNRSLGTYDLREMENIGPGFWKKKIDHIPKGYFKNTKPIRYGPDLPNDFFKKKKFSGPQKMENIFCPF
jgi:hypothetical protein